MALALSNAAVLRPEIRLVKALSEYESVLDNAQKANFRSLKSGNPPVGEDVMRLTAQIDRDTVQHRRSRRCVGPRLTNILHAVQQFSTVVDIVVGGSQNVIACSIWGVAKFSLQLAIGFSSCFDKISTLFMAVGRACPRYHEFTILFPKSQSLRNAACLYFATFVRMCKQIVLFLRKSFLSQIADTFKSFSAEFDSFQTELLALGSLIREEISLASKHLQVYEAEAQDLERKEMLSFRLMESKSRQTISRETAQFRQTISKELAEVKQWRQDCQLSRFFDACSTFDHRVAWKQARKCGTSRWFYGSHDHNTWKSSKQNHILCCTGILGSGKTVLAANVVADLTLASDKHVAFLFCRHDDLRSLKARTIIGSLIRQILEPVRSRLDIGGFRASLSSGALSFSHREVSDLLAEFLSVIHDSITIVINGLDECNVCEVGTVLSWIRRLEDLSPFKEHIFKFFISSRPELLKSMPQKLQPTFFLSMADGNEDLKNYIEDTLDERYSDGSLQLIDSSIKTTIRNALEYGAQGMFLWAYLQIQEICSRKTDHSVLEALNELPGDLPDTFDRVLAKLSRAGKESRALLQKMFKIAIGAVVPLSLEELQEALSVEPGRIVWDPQKFVKDVQSMIDSTGGLLFMDEEAETVHFVHHSVKRYLLDLPIPGSDAAYYKTTQIAASGLLGSICLTYLNFNIFDSHMVRSDASQKKLHLDPASIIETSIQEPGIVSQLAIAYLKRKQNSKPNIMPKLYETAKDSKVHPYDKLAAFLAHSQKHWPFYYRKYATSSDPFGPFEFGVNNASMALRYVYLKNIWDVVSEHSLPLLKHPHSAFLAVAAHRAEVLEQLTGLERTFRITSAQLGDYGVVLEEICPSPAIQPALTTFHVERVKGWSLWMLATILGNTEFLNKFVYAPRPLLCESEEVPSLSLMAYKIAVSRRDYTTMDFITSKLARSRFKHIRCLDSDSKDILFYAVNAGDSTALMLDDFCVPGDARAVDPSLANLVANHAIVALGERIVERRLNEARRWKIHKEDLDRYMKGECDVYKRNIEALVVPDSLMYGEESLKQEKGKKKRKDRETAYDIYSYDQLDVSDAQLALSLKALYN
ncbi:hypothetical protein MMC10_004969 [Thelotrema lepadinum]|nr:hypothetical protein [Thelotrema lepadinum]